MNNEIKLLIVILATILLLIGVFKINPVRYAAVRVIWKLIDWISMKSVAKELVPEGVKTVTGISYIEQSTPEQLLDAYYPENSTGRLPVIIYIHGGGFVAGDKAQIKPYCMTLAKEGFTVFNINYRLAPNNGNLVQMQDVLAAMMWVNENCEKYSGDKNRIILAGDSAGAYLAGFSACIHACEPLASKLNMRPVFSANQLKGVLLFSGVFDLETASITGFPAIKSDIEMFLNTGDIKNYPNINDWSVTKNVTGIFPRTFISSGAVDRLHTESAALIGALDTNHVYHKDILFDKSENKAMHDYQLRMDKDTSRQCFKSVIEFLKTITE